MWNARLEEAQAGIKTARRNINQPQIYRWYHSNGRKWRGTKEPLNEDERGEWKGWLKTQHVKTKIMKSYQFSTVQSLSRVQLFVTPWTTAHQASLSITNSWSPPKPMSIELVMPSNYLILCHPLLLLSSVFPSIRVFSNESALCIRWRKYWSFSFNISPTNEHPGLISFRMDWLDLLAVQGTLKSLLQHHSSKASILLSSAFLIVQLSHPYMTTGKTTALTRRPFVGKVMSLLFNMLSRYDVIFLLFFLRRRNNDGAEWHSSLFPRNAFEQESVFFLFSFWYLKANENSWKHQSILVYAFVQRIEQCQSLSV